MANVPTQPIPVPVLTKLQYNYGQFTTLWDRMGGSYRKPNDELFSRESKMGQKEWERQTKEMEKIVREVEGDDDRSYGDEAATIQKKLL